MSDSNPRFAHAALAEAIAGPRPGADSILIGRYGDAEVKFYAPRGTDDQQPHKRDELYIVASGSGVFSVEGRRFRFEPGDMLFAAAGVEHRFAEFGDDFGTWVIFYGPERS